MNTAFVGGARSSGLWALAGGLAIILTACGGEDPGAGMGQRTPEVAVVRLQPETVAVTADYPGRARGAREVEVRARVAGILEERLYVEGQTVSRDDPLFRIDPQPFELALRQAEAELANAQAAFNQAEREWNRASGLYQRNAISTRERDQARSGLELAEAGLALARAGVATAQLNLDWARVRAPVDGATGLETLSEGSLVDRGSLLTTLTQLHPIHIRFSLPETDAALQRAARRAMADPGGDHQRQAILLLPDGSEYPLAGSVDFTDASIDPRTGSVSGRAIFPNEEGLVVPGQFVRVRIQIREIQDAYRIPPDAVSQGREGARVFIVDDQGQARARPVELGPVVDSDQIILSGLEPGNRLVVTGHLGLQDGTPVTATDAADPSGTRSPDAQVRDPASGADPAGAD